MVNFNDIVTLTKTYHNNGLSLSLYFLHSFKEYLDAIVY